MYKLFGKRFIGCLLSFLGLVVTCIPMIIIAIAIKLDSKGPIIFKQERLGKNQRIFTIYKFRTMVNHAYEMGGVATRSDDARITKVGAFLRRTSLDELPQMVNILKGDMAIIGPRPILDWEFADNNNKPEYVKRFDVRPGLFCTVDVEHRNADRDLQFEMDAEYAEKNSFALDVKTFFKVIKTVVTGKGVYKDEKVGNQNEVKEEVEDNV